MISKYLKELIETSNRVIVPQFGAFMIQDTTNGKEISFNDFLKFPDATIANAIIRDLKVSKAEADLKIKEFIKDANEKFAKGEPFVIEGVGVLTKDTHGNIKFTKEIEKVIVEPEAKTSPTDTTPTMVLDESDKPEKETKEEEKIKIVPKEEKKEQPVVQKKVSTPEPPKPPVVNKEQPAQSQSSVKSKSVNKATVSVSSQKKKPVETAKPKQKSKPKEVKRNVQQTDKNLKPVIVIAVIVIVVVAGIVAAFEFGFIGSDKDTQEKVVSTAPVVETPKQPEAPAIDSTVEKIDAEQSALSQQESAKEEVVNIKKEETTPIVGNKVTNNKYFVIGGSFKVYANAESFKLKLQQEGYDAEIIKRSSGFNFVSYGSYPTRNEAVVAMRKIRTSNNNNVWIFENK